MTMGKQSLASFPDQQLKYIPQLDGLRGIAVLLVIIFHSAPDILPGGYLGVDMFFVLSGYLITRILVSEHTATGRISMKEFYKRRALRLFPAFYSMLIILSFLALFRTDPIFHLKAIAISGSYLMNWARAFETRFEVYLGHTWSLSIEEQFYIIYPVILLFLLNTINRQNIWKWILSLLVIVFVWRMYLITSGANLNRTYNGFDTRADSLLFGCLISIIKFNYLSIKYMFLPFIMSLFFIIYCSLFVTIKNDWMNYYGFTLAAISSGFIILHAVNNPTSIFSQLAATMPLVKIGKISYGMYLWHYPILYGVVRFIDYPPFILVACMVLTIGVASLSFKYIESPALRLRHR